jgi:hypothetical protein
MKVRAARAARSRLAEGAAHSERDPTRAGGGATKYTLDSELYPRASAREGIENAILEHGNRWVRQRHHVR